MARPGRRSRPAFPRALTFTRCAKIPSARACCTPAPKRGVWVSFDDGAHWQKLQLNLPTVPVHDLVIKDDDLVVATHGRAFWILDDLTPLRKLASADRGRDGETAPAAAGLSRAFPRRGGQARARRARIPRPAPSFTTTSKTAPKDEVKMEILDGQGNVVKTYSSVKKEEVAGPSEWPDVQHVSEVLPVDAGLNRFFWNLRYEDPVTVPGNFYETDIPPKGPMALPGVYQVRLTVERADADGAARIAPGPAHRDFARRSGRAVRAGAADCATADVAAQHRQ